MSFQRDLQELINRYSQEKESCTPDFILAGYLVNCLEAFNRASVAKRDWYARPPKEIVERE